MSATPAASEPITSALAQPAPGARTGAQVRANSPAPASTMPVRSSCDRGAAALAQPDRGQGGHRQPDGHVDPEDPLPGQALHHGAAQDRAGRDAEAGQGAPDADGRAALLGREGVADQRQGERQQQGRAAALDGAGGDQHPGAGRQGGEGRPGHEDQQAGHVHAAAAEPVAERGAGEHQAAEDQVVGVDGPLQVGQAGPQVGPHGGQRGRDDHDVEGGHERPHPGQRERPARPGPAGRGGRRAMAGAAGEPVAGPRLALGAAGAADSSDMVMLLVRSARIGRGRVAALKR